MLDTSEMFTLKKEINNYFNLYFGDDKTPRDLVIDFNEVKKSRLMSDYIQNNSWDKFIALCVDVAKDFTWMLGPDSPYRDIIYGVTIINYDAPPILIRDLRNIHNNMLINIDCVVKKTQDVHQEAVKIGMRCSACEEGKRELIMVKLLPDGKIPAGTLCPNDPKHGQKALYRDPDHCIFKDVQEVVIQDTSYSSGKQPKAIPMYVFGDMVDKLMPGNRCRVTCIVKTKFEKNNIATQYLECYGYEKKETDTVDIVITQEDEELIKIMATNPDIYDRLAESINPAIYGYDSVKLALVLQMFGGRSLEREDGSRVRGTSHILLCGDPAMAKSELIRAVYNINVRTVYSSGRSTSGAGLTAACVRDEITGKWTLEAGAMVLADGGMCIIDELDKMNDNDRSALHEAMEFQTISVNKANLSETLNTRCAILAAANPKNGKFIEGEAVHDQVNLTPALISRFDLVYTMIDKPDKTLDGYVARSIIDSHYGRGKTSNRPVSIDTFRKYITYAKQIDIVISDEIAEYLTDTYTELRGRYGSSVVTPRQLNGLERLAVASARVQLCKEVRKEDAQRATNLFLNSLESLTLNKSIDIKKVFGGMTDNEVRAETSICSYLTQMPYEYGTLLSEVSKNNYGVSKTDVGSVLSRMIRDNKVKVVESADGTKMCHWVVKNIDS